MCSNTAEKRKHMYTKQDAVIETLPQHVLQAQGSCPQANCMRICEAAGCPCHQCHTPQLQNKPSSKASLSAVKNTSMSTKTCSCSCYRHHKMQRPCCCLQTTVAFTDSAAQAALHCRRQYPVPPIRSRRLEHNGLPSGARSTMEVHSTCLFACSKMNKSRKAPQCPHLRRLRFRPHMHRL